MPWWQFFALGCGWYVLANVVFALAYLACGSGALVSTSSGIADHPFWRAFFFSVETISTIGYGNVVPTGLAANLVVTAEALAGLAGFAIVTGLLFARISRPTANVLFSSHAVVAPYQNITALEFRVANARSNELIEVSAKVIVSRFEQVDGVHTRRYYPLKLERDGGGLSSVDLDRGSSYRTGQHSSRRNGGFDAQFERGNPGPAEGV